MSTAALSGAVSPIAQSPSWRPEARQNIVSKSRLNMVTALSVPNSPCEWIGVAVLPTPAVPVAVVPGLHRISSAGPSAQGTS